MNHLTIGSIVCDQPIFKPVDLIPLLGETTRGNNRVMPGAGGQRATKWVRDQIDVTLTWYVDGRHDAAGSVTSPGTGLLNNLAYYKAAFFNQANATTGCTSATLTLESGTLTAQVQCRDWSPYWTGPLSATVATRIVIPAGEWT